MSAIGDDTDATITIATTGVEDGQVMTLTLNAIDYTGAVNNNNAILVIPASDLQALTEGVVTMTANVTDLAGNIATEESFSFTYETLTLEPVLSASVTEENQDSTVVADNLSGNSYRK